MANQKILVTGGGGYIGVLLVEKLLEKGYRVRVFDKFFWGEKPLGHLKGKIETVQGDIRKPPASIVKGISAVIHLAAFSNDPMAEFDPKANYEVNTLGTKRIAQLAKKNGVGRFILASSASIYDRGLKAKIELRDEKAKVKPIAPYSVSKYEAERELLKLADDDFCPVILRKGTVYGASPRMRYDLVVNTLFRDGFLTKKLTVFCGGVQWRPLVDVEDVVGAYLLCLTAPEEKVKGEIFNLVYKNYRVLEVAREVKKAFKKVLGKDLEIDVDNSFRKDRSYKISGRKIKRVLGWEPKISVGQSVERMIKKAKAQGWNDFMHPKYYNIKWMSPIFRAEKTKKGGLG